MWSLALMLAAAPAVPAWTDPLADRELAELRGGFLLPNGLDIAIGIDIQTRIDGALALHTVYTSEAPNAGIRVFTDGRDSGPPANATNVPSGSGSGAPVIEAGRAPTGTVVVPAGWGQSTNVNVVAGATSTWPDAAGQKPVAVTGNGPPVAADTGTIQLATDARGATVTLVAPGIEVRHLIGQATGAVVSNVANDRLIDTTSTVNVNLAGVPVALLGGALTLNRIVSEAVSRR